MIIKYVTSFPCDKHLTFYELSLISSPECDKKTFIFLNAYVHVLTV